MNRISGKMLLLIELCILLVFFCFSSAVCAYLFVAADKKSSNADMLSRAVVETTSIAETLKATGGNMAKTGALLDHKETLNADENHLTLYYDHNFEPILKDGGKNNSGKSTESFEAKIVKKSSGSCNSYKIVIFHMMNSNANDNFSKNSNIHNNAGKYNKDGRHKVANREKLYSLSFKSVETGGGSSETP